MADSTRVKIICVPGCPYCKKAADLAVSLGSGFSIELIIVDWESPILSEAQQLQPGWKTVPMVYIDDEFVGGFTDFQKYVSDNDVGQK